MKANERLKELRMKKGESREEVAKAVGVSTSSICQYELGDKVPRDNIKMALAKHFGRTVQFIFFSDTPTQRGKR